MKKGSLFIIFLIILGGGIFLFFQQKRITPTKQSISPIIVSHPSTMSPRYLTQTPTLLDNLKISKEKEKSYPGSSLKVVATLPAGVNYNQYIVSFQSEGDTIYALLSIPQGPKPSGGWPVILFNHGYIPPTQYSTVYSYATPFAALASEGYIVFKPDYRGNGNSTGSPSQVYISDGYVIDSMNALSSIIKYKDPLTGSGLVANSQKIGVWGHSMGGNITLRELVITPTIKAAVLWAGVVGDSSQILSWWQMRIQNKSIVGNDLQTADIIQEILTQVGTPSQNPTLWNSIDSTQYLSSINGPVQIDVGTEDTTVPPNFSTDLAAKLLRVGKTVELFTYLGADHNLSPDSSLAMQRTIAFFNKYLK